MVHLEFHLHDWKKWADATVYKAEELLNGSVSDQVTARVLLGIALPLASLGTTAGSKHSCTAILSLPLLGLLSPAEAVRRSYQLGVVKRPQNAIVKTLTSKPVVCAIAIAALAGLWYWSRTSIPETPLIHQPSSAGMYLLKDDQGQTIASFKPESERPYGPEDIDALRRRLNPSNDDIYFHQMDSIDQGRASERQALALTLEIGQVARMPRGKITEIASREFVDLHETTKRLQVKTGFLQEWISGATPLADTHSIPGPLQPNYQFENRTLLDQVPLDEFQKIGLQDILLYNQDRHPGNVLVKNDATGNPHLVPIDHDAILPFTLNKFKSLLGHRRAAEPFTTSMLKAIRAINPERTYQLVRETSLPEQAAINAKALALTVKSFAERGRTLADLFQFISTQAERTTSALWDLMTTSKELAKQGLSEADQAMIKHERWLRHCLWNKDADVPENAVEWLSQYKKTHATRINEQLQNAFWTLFQEYLNQ
jgi:hypothetical protein